MKPLYITMSYYNYVEVERDAVSKFDNPQVYQPRHNVAPTGIVYIIPSDNQSYIYPATYRATELKGDIIPAVILCSGYLHKGSYINFQGIVGLKADCVDTGGNKYEVKPVIKGGDPVVIPAYMLLEFDLVI